MRLIAGFTAGCILPFAASSGLFRTGALTVRAKNMISPWIPTAFITEAGAEARAAVARARVPALVPAEAEPAAREKIFTRLMPMNSLKF